MMNRIFVAVLASALRSGAATEEELGATCTPDSSNDCEAEHVGLLQTKSSSDTSLEASQAGWPAKCEHPHGCGGCAGKDIRVVTDMGFDDWGAFSVLHAAGCTPTRALATKGMMLPSTFAGDFSVLLQSWGLRTKVYMGSEDCYDSVSCINSSFIEDSWGYRTNVEKAYSTNAKGPYPAESDVRPGADFWECSHGKKYTLAVISPMSDVAIELSKNRAARKCIEEVVVMGSFFAKSANGELVLGGKDESTKGGLMYGTVPVPDGQVGNTELNVVSDIKAAQAVLGYGLNLKLMPLEVASIDRAGRQLIKGQYSAEKQVTLTTKAVGELCGPLGRSGQTTSMLEGMACIHVSGGAEATMDMDAIAVTWLWTGKKRYELKSKNVKVEKTDGETKFCNPRLCRHCNSVDLGWEFDAVGWIEDLKALEA